MSERKGNFVYTRPGCGGSTLVMNWMNENNVEYETINVMEDGDAMARIQDAGYMSLPVVEKDGDFVLNEYHPELLTDLFL